LKYSISFGGQLMKGQKQIERERAITKIASMIESGKERERDREKEMKEREKERTNKE
jgi:hypothetical protein